MKSDFYFAANY